MVISSGLAGLLKLSVWTTKSTCLQNERERETENPGDIYLKPSPPPCFEKESDILCHSQTST